MTRNDAPKTAATASMTPLEHGHDADPVAFVQAVKDAERTGHAAVMFRLLLDGEADATLTRSVVDALGTNGQQLVDAYLAARAELTQALRANVQRSRDLVKAKLRVMLPASLTEDASGSELFPRVVDVNSATLRDDGSIWGFLRVNTRKNCFDSWEYTWKDGEIRILNEPEVY
jgi:hypothetical protein